ncbi:MAG TPA: OmpA family protein [Nannocystaceae bacterium]|nr:OmpA family protein [Nannocystaceae bacterium]
MKNTPRNLLLFAGIVVLGACKKDQVEDPDLFSPSDSASGPADESKEAADEVAAVRVDDRIAKLCNMPTANFAFDSSKLGKPAKRALGMLADCFIDGPAKGEGMQIVGHADPRGEDDYNLALGQRRADAVADYLSHQGLEARRVATTSRGELDAVGSDESGWADDRRVDILLADR